jgi:hypothetical protein
MCESHMKVGINSELELTPLQTQRATAGWSLSSSWYFMFSSHRLQTSDLPGRMTSERKKVGSDRVVLMAKEPRLGPGVFPVEPRDACIC